MVSWDTKCCGYCETCDLIHESKMRTPQVHGNPINCALRRSELTLKIAHPRESRIWRLPPNRWPAPNAPSSVWFPSFCAACHSLQRPSCHCATMGRVGRTADLMCRKSRAAQSIPNGSVANVVPQSQLSCGCRIAVEDLRSCEQHEWSQ